MGFDFCIDHRSDDFPGHLAAACPKGIDVYFENVGGVVFDAVLPLLNAKARVPVCGLVAAYNATELPVGPDRLGLLAATLLRKRIKVQGFGQELRQAGHTVRTRVNLFATMNRAGFLGGSGLGVTPP